MIRWLPEVHWIEPARVEWLGQTSPATEGTVKTGFSNAEKILLASVLISATGLVVHLLELSGAIGTRRSP